MNNERRIKAVRVPEMRSDGRAVHLSLVDEDDSEIGVTIATTDLGAILGVLVRASQVAKTRRTLTSETHEPNDHFELTPVLYVAEKAGLATQPEDDIAYLVVLTHEQQEIHIRFDWPQLRSLIALIQRFDNIQSADLDSTLPS